MNLKKVQEILFDISILEEDFWIRVDVLFPSADMEHNREVYNGL